MSRMFDDATRPADTKHILIVEDNPTNQTLILSFLKSLGYKADCAADGLEGLRRLAIAPYDLVLMDCQMPIMDGYEATRRIRQGDLNIRDTRIPIVAVTANALKGDRQKCLDAGMDDYLAKPVKKKDLGEIIARNLRADSTAEPE